MKPPIINGKKEEGCPNCEKPIIWKVLIPQHKEEQHYFGKEKILTEYFYDCPYCKVKLSINKDYVREAWAKAHPNIPFSRKLG